MRKLPRRNALTAIGSAGSMVLAGCVDELPGGTSEEEELREQWEENDDYPDDDFRNLEQRRRDLGYLLYPDGPAETTFGYHIERLTLINTRDHYRSVTAEVFFEASKPVDIYAIPGQIETEMGEHPDLDEYEHIPEYSEFGTETYQEVFETTAEEENYTLLITLADYRPPQTVQGDVEFVEEREEAELDGQIETAAYVPFEEYKDNETAQFDYDDTDLLNDDED